VKLEGAELAGYQSIIVGGIRDPYIIRQLDSWLGSVRGYIDESVARVLGDKADKSLYSIIFHTYGINAVMGRLEPDPKHLPHEVGIVLEATAPTQDMAHKLAQLSRQPLLHYPIEEWVGSITAFACLHNPAVIDRGPGIPFQPEPCRGSFHSCRDVSHSLYRFGWFEQIMILANIATLIRSKNAGPFTLTFDIMFADVCELSPRQGFRRAESRCVCRTLPLPDREGAFLRMRKCAGIQVQHSTAAYAG